MRACYNACVLVKSDAEWRFNADWSNALFERILCAAAAVATIAGFILEVWREMKSNAHEDDKGRKKKGRS